MGKRPKTRSKSMKRTAARAGGARKPPRKARAQKRNARKPDAARQAATARDFIDAAAQTLGLVIDPAWKPAIEANVATTMRLAASFMDFPLPDEAEPAPVFEA